jgi:hypothetical protein
MTNELQNCDHQGEWYDLMMEAASASETSVNFYQEKQPNNLGDSDLHA